MMQHYKLCNNIKKMDYYHSNQVECLPHDTLKMLPPSRKSKGIIINSKHHCVEGQLVTYVLQVTMLGEFMIPLEDYQDRMAELDPVCGYITKSPNSNVVNNLQKIEFRLPLSQLSGNVNEEETICFNTQDFLSQPMCISTQESQLQNN